jgi:hypothetical protein
MSVRNLLVLIAIYLVLTFLAAIVVERSIGAAFKGLKLALKSELTSDVGRLNFVAMILMVLLMFVFNVHEMFSSALAVGGNPQTKDHVLGPAALVGFFFMGSLICVMLVERNK